MLLRSDVRGALVYQECILIDLIRPPVLSFRSITSSNLDVRVLAVGDLQCATEFPKYGGKMSLSQLRTK